jgi:hypothetical protein
MSNIDLSEYRGHDYYEDEPIDGVGFQDPGGKSALRRSTKKNPRNRPCPTCHKPNRLTPIDVKRGYQCNECADRLEMGF